MPSGRPPRFRVKLPQQAIAVRPNSREFRTSPRTRGLDSAWDRTSIAYRRRHPFCRFCDQEGKDSLVDRVDHILPRREYPHLKFEWSNLQGLCTHHDNLKQAMEVHARATGQLEQLPFWCEAIENRPAQFRARIIAG